MAQRRYAEGTTVPIGRSREELERVLERFGASQQAWMRDDEQGRVTLAFRRGGRTYRFTVTLSSASHHNLTPTRKPRLESAAREAADAENRRRFRSLTNYVKALLDAVETGILVADEALLPYMVLPEGRTIAEYLEPQVARMLEGGSLPNITTRALPSA